MGCLFSHDMIHVHSLNNVDTFLAVGELMHRVVIKYLALNIDKRLRRGELFLINNSVAEINGKSLSSKIFVVGH